MTTLVRPAMSETTPDFALLMQRARAGDPAAITELVRRYEPDVRLVARVLLGPALRPFLDSVDLVQSVHRMMLLGLQAGKFDLATPEKLIALALTLVRRRVARHWRRARRQERHAAGPAASGDAADVLRSLTSAQPDPASAAQSSDHIQHFLDQLTPDERQLVELRLQGYRPGEIAQTLGLDAAALRMRLSRLRRRFQEAGLFPDCV